jgi:hypothetical protein
METNENIFLALLSPNSYEILQSIPLLETFQTNPLFGYFGDPRDASEYLKNIKFWITKRLAS